MTHTRNLLEGRTVHTKELERNFREPEESFFFEQLFVDSIRSVADGGGWATLAEIVDAGKNDAEAYEVDLEGSTGKNPKIFEKLTGYDQSVDEFLTEELVSRVLLGSTVRATEARNSSTPGCSDFRDVGEFRIHGKLQTIG